MKAKALKHPAVEFFATSSRLADAYRSAAKRNKRLSRCALIHELGHPTLAIRAHALQVVILSHPDDHLVLTQERVQATVAKGFHLLFTDSTTHPGQVAEWMRATRIRSE